MRSFNHVCFRKRTIEIVELGYYFYRSLPKQILPNDFEDEEEDPLKARLPLIFSGFFFTSSLILRSIMLLCLSGGIPWGYLHKKNEQKTQMSDYKPREHFCNGLLSFSRRRGNHLASRIIQSITSCGGPSL